VPVDVSEHSNASVSIQSWTPGPRDPQLGAAAVDVWRVDLAGAADDLLELLSAHEHARAERMARARDRTLWARSRGVLRALLGRYLQADPRELSLATSAGGKPVLDTQNARTERVADATRLCFNLSHSGETALYAFSRAGRVGIDVEATRRPVDSVALATRALGPAEAARLRKLDPQTRAQEFLRAWVRHEAALKCVGTGIWADPEKEAEPQPWTADLDLGGPGCAAIAVERAPSELRCWDWPI
jgi:4'-phosphopantetheinyl transferase